MSKQKVALFDIDGTVFRSSLFIELVNGLIKEGIFPPETGETFAEAYDAWQNREGNYEDYINSMVKVFMEEIKGAPYGAVVDVGRTVVARQHKKVYRYTRGLIKSLRSQGYYVVAISNSPKFILDDFCEQYGFHKVYGRIYEIGPQDRFTGQIIDLHLIQNKVNILKRLMENSPELTLEESVAVGDTESDIPLLEAVSHPICFNPNQKLYTVAKRQKWEVVVERKDVIYYL